MILQAVLMAEFTGIGFFFIGLFFFTLVWAGELQIWLTELHAFLSLLCLFGWEFELVEFKCPSDWQWRVFIIIHLYSKASLAQYLSICVI